MSIKHNATYVPLKSDLRPATTEEKAKYKDASKHGRKKATVVASSGVASASGTTIETEAGAGTSKVRDPRESKGKSAFANDKSGKSDPVRSTKSRSDKDLHGEPNRDYARRAQETADEQDAAEDESDMRKCAELKDKMDARRIAREIKIAHDTLASLRAEQNNASEKSETATKTLAGSDREKKCDAFESRETKGKSRATRPSVGTTVGEQGAQSIIGAKTRVDESRKAKSTASGNVEQADVASVSKRAVVRNRTKKSTTTKESVPNTARKIAAQSSGEEFETEVLGPALVAGALGRRIGDARTTTMMRGITECRVRLLTTQQKAELPVPPAPNNSAESNSAVEIPCGYDGRLSLSATDLHVQLELPGEVTGSTAEIMSPAAPSRKAIAETVTTEPRRIFLISVIRPIDDIEINSSGIQILAATETEIIDRSKDCVETDKGPLGGGKAERGGDTEGTSGRRRTLRDIDIAEKMREHLAETHPELTTAASFLDSVCGRMRAPKKNETSESSAAKKGELTTAETSDASVAKKGESIVAETSESTAAKAIESPATKMSGVGATEQPSHGITLPSKAVPESGRKIGVDKYRGGGDFESDSDREMTDVVILGDTEMSEGETSDNESESQSGSCSGSYSSAHSRASRKRAAEYSPNGNPGEMSGALSLV